MAGYELELAKMKQAEYRAQSAKDALGDEVFKLERRNSPLWCWIKNLFHSKIGYHPTSSTSIKQGQ